MTSSPSVVMARWTWAIEALASGVSSNVVKSWASGLPRPASTALRTEHLAAPDAVAAAFGATTTAAVHVIAELNDQIVELETASFAKRLKERKIALEFTHTSMSITASCVVMHLTACLE
jgi:hypothetical protein